MIQEPPFKYNREVRLRPETDTAHRQPYEILQATIVRWVQCSTCRKRFWYALAADTPPEELWWWGARFRQQLKAEGCANHPTD
jgi:hypothetical protein